MVTNAFRDTGMPVAEPAVFVEGTVREEDVMTLRDKEAVVERMEEPELLWMCPPPRKPPQVAPQRSNAGQWRRWRWRPSMRRQQQDGWG